MQGGALCCNRTVTPGGVRPRLWASSAAVSEYLSHISFCFARHENVSQIWDYRDGVECVDEGSSEGGVVGVICGGRGEDWGAQWMCGCRSSNLWQARCPSLQSAYGAANSRGSDVVCVVGTCWVEQGQVVVVLSLLAYTVHSYPVLLMVCEGWGRLWVTAG